jgi:PBSX family phage terminase large subunit
VIAKLPPKAAASVHLAQARTNLWEGSVRSGKTIASLLAWLLYVRTGPAGNLAMIGKTERTLKRNVIDPLVEMLGERRCKHNRGEGEIRLLGRRIYTAGANDARSEDKIRGLTLAGAYVDEASLVPEAFWSMLLTRLSVEGAQLFATSNPDNPHHWLMRDYLRRAAVHLDHDGTVRQLNGGLDLARFSFRIADNPTLSPAYVAALSAEFTGLWRKRFVEGLWVLAEGAIYDTFEPEPGGAHVVTGLPRLDRLTLSVDYGTTNPFVALLIGRGVDETGTERLYVAREWRHDSKAAHRQMTDAEYSAALREWVDGLPAELGQPVDLERMIVDPSAASFIAQLWRDGWGGVRGADNAVADGIRATSSLLAGRLKVHESCAGLIGEMSGYVWDSKAAEGGVEKPIKLDDHGPDALRYGVMGTRRIWRHWLSVDLPEAAAA